MSKARTLVSLAFLILAAALISTVLYLSMDEGTSNRVSGRAGLAVGQQAPPIEAQGWLNGQAPAPGSLAGKVIFVEAWASW